MSGITNTGTTSEIFLHNTTFSGNVVNTGNVTSGLVELSSSISGALINTGHITGHGVDFDAGTFSGGITNAGTIVAAANAAILLDDVVSFVGGITNGGTISSGAVGISTFKTPSVSILDFRGDHWRQHGH